MRIQRYSLLHIFYWISVVIVLVLIFGSSWKSHLLALYFSLLLLPTVLLTSYFFNSFLVPKYLFTRRYGKFALYFSYMLVVSLYLEMLVSFFSFVIIAKANPALVDLEGISIFILGITLYLIVFIVGFIRLVKRVQRKENTLANLTLKKQRNEQKSLVIRADRKNHLIPLNELIYLESLKDYVKVVTADSELLTREKITNLSGKLPDQFVRIHRSFVVNSEKVQSFSATELHILNTCLPISRTYKNEATAILESLQQDFRQN